MKKLIVILSLLVIIFTGCSSVIKIQESYRADNYDFTLLHDSNIKFVGTDKIYLKEFVNTFKDEYSDKNKLNDKLFELFSIEFKKQIPGSKLSRLEIKIPKILSGDLSFKDYTAEVGHSGPCTGALSAGRPARCSRERGTSSPLDRPASARHTARPRLPPQPSF